MKYTWGSLPMYERTFIVLHAPIECAHAWDDELKALSERPNKNQPMPASRPVGGQSYLFVGRPARRHCQPDDLRLPPTARAGTPHPLPTSGRSLAAHEA